ncbi:dynamin family protein [Streptomyces sp. NPDC058295]|uniref:dynamin family protein n=1 Tax=Streptomyces sp. NPDC058295 TaxID=3346431 RepID=UPI0036E2FE6E
MAPPGSYGAAFTPGGSPREIEALLGGITEALNELRHLDTEAGGHAVDGFAAGSARVTEISRRYGEPYRLGVVGDFNAGKSTLINMMLGRRGAVVEGVVATTGTLTELWWGGTESGEVLDQDGATLFRGTLEEAQRYTDQRTVEGRSVHGRRVRVILRLPAGVLKNLIILDTPGLSATQADDATTMEALHLVDAAVLVVSGHQPGGDKAVRLAEQLRRTRRRFLVVVTKKNKIPDVNVALAAVMDTFGATADGEPVAVDSIDGLAALQELRTVAHGGDPEAVRAAQDRLAASGYTALYEHLSASFLGGQCSSGRSSQALSDVRDTLKRLVARAERQAERLTAEAEKAGGEKDKHAEFVKTALFPQKRRLDRRLEDLLDLHIGELLEDVAEAAELAVEQVHAQARRMAVQGLWASISSIFTDDSGLTLAERMERMVRDALGPDRLRIFSHALHRAALGELSFGWNESDLRIDEVGEVVAAELGPVLTQVTAGAQGLVEEASDELFRSVTMMCHPASQAVAATEMLLNDLGIGAGAQRRRDQLSLARRQAATGVRATRASLHEAQGKFYRAENAKIFKRLKAEADRRAGEGGRLQMEAQERSRQWQEAADVCARLADACGGLGPTRVSASEGAERGR